ncbi:Uu.00g093140.m01.CDS01 [Anthostomella pinea]|uniref:Uu.00g093140.m01.CDS01 n=1 Tax=Anthostomella pinea TaxID=933095 RepID=A0AAI8VNH7_9PEZI|nr:Uu.00g093140.m01.CDS01 [Anthostomella pinea]
MQSLRDQLSQVFPGTPHFTEKNLPSLTGRVYVVTGANTGVGKQLARILYSKDAKVYIAARSREKALSAIEDIKNAAPESRGELVFLPLDLADLAAVKTSAQEFLGQESKLHVLFNNAGVMIPPGDQTTAQGYESQLGVNNVGTHLFTKLLTPTLIATAKSSTPNSVRVVWVASSAAESPIAPKGGVLMDNLDYHRATNNWSKYAISKAGNYLQGAEFARRHRADGVVSVPLNPGNLDSDLWRHQGFVMGRLIKWFLLQPVVNGAYTELFAGLSPDVTMEKSGEWIAPWGRFVPIRKDLKAATLSKDEGGTGVAAEFWEWNEAQVKPFV